MYDELTEVDIKKMQEEIDHRVRVLRPQLIEEVQTARAFGDLSENFEYKCAKQAKNRNESRIRYLERMIRTDSQQYRAGGTQGCTRRNAQHIGLRQRVLHHGLHNHAAYGQAGADGKRQQQAGHPDIPNHISHRTGNRHKFRSAEQMTEPVANIPQNNFVYIFQGYLNRTYGYRKQQ